MINPASIMKIMNAKNKFTANNTKFAAFLNAVFSTGITEGTIIEITVTKPGEEDPGGTVPVIIGAAAVIAAAGVIFAAVKGRKKK